jgi:DNA-binding FadR family transcriptional regulator
MVALGDDPAALLTLDFEVFREYARAGGSIVGQLLLNTVRGPFEQHQAPFVSMATDREMVVNAARAIAAAVRDHDGDAASQEADRYLRAGAAIALEAARAQVTDAF